jgi:hypothetical protein
MCVLGTSVAVKSSIACPPPVAGALSDHRKDFVRTIDGQLLHFEIGCRWIH